MSKQKSTLGKKLSRTIMLLTTVLFVVVLGIFYQHAKSLLHKEAIERSSTILDTTVQLVVNHLTAIETAARSNAWMIEEHFDPDSLQKISRRIVSLNKSVISCSISTKPDIFPQWGKYFSAYSVNDGDTIITVLEPEFEYFEKNWYKEPVETGRPCWINPFSDFQQGDINHHAAVGSFCIPIRINGGHIVGVISADFSFQRLRETVFATRHPYPNSYYMLIGPAGGYLIHPESNLLFKKSILQTDSIEHPDILELGRKMTSGQHGTIHVKFNDQKCHVCYAPVPGTGWSMALVCSEDEVMADYYHLTTIMVVIVLIGLLLIWWFTSKLVEQNITPLNDLLDATKKISEGEYDIEIPLSKRKDSFSKLQNAFREMQQAILKEMEGIKRTTDELNQETKKLEEAMPRAKEAARRRQTFIQNVIYQISSPISIIEGLMKVLLDNLGRLKGKKRELQKDEITNITKTLDHNARHLQRITMMLYDSSDTRAADASMYERKDIVSCNKAGEEYVNITKELYHIDNIQFTTELSDDVTIQTNRLYLKLTIQELLHNAVKYSDGEHISLHVTQTDTMVQFIIVDEGPGLPEFEKDLLYIPFMKNDNLSEGLGLGLPLCHRHVISLGGNLIYDEEYTKGCRFILEMPK